MRNLTITEAFKKFNAKLNNNVWAYSAIAEDGSIVVSCWSHKLGFVKESKKLIYEDYLSKWMPESLGKKLFVEHLSQGFEKELLVRLVIATPAKPILPDQEYDPETNKVQKSFHAKEGMVGKVTFFDGDHFIIEFSAV